MPKFQVVVEITETFDVEADSAEEACELEIAGEAGEATVSVTARYALNENGDEA